MVIGSIVILSHQFPIYLDISVSKSLKPSNKILMLFKDHKEPIKITFFCSNALIDDLQLTPIQNWLLSISKSFKIVQIDPVKFPAKADHYDITSDGIIVLESNQKRFDIDIVDMILTHSDFSIQVLQNYLLKGLLNITSTTQKNIVIIHSSPESIINDDRPLGLSTLTNILNNNNIQLSEFNLDSIQDIPLSFDALILYKLGPNIIQHTATLNYLIDSAPSLLMLSHPKFSEFSNNLISDVYFNTEIIHDDTFHLMNSANQLIVDYTSKLNKQLIAILPYSSFISFDDDNNIKPIANSSEYSYVMYDNNSIPGPFTIIAKSKTKNHYYINNHLIASNHWIIQGNNNEIIQDIIYSMVETHPIIQTNNINKLLILSYNTLFSLIILLIILPVGLTVLIQFIYRFFKITV
ncbi:MAG: hypothetical protein VXX85_06455 [Candidatus Margulisiibacteriota bacterium]|nr:hypothetical protein [Candidatus Margulisiibacteriota bacterium]